VLEPQAEVTWPTLVVGVAIPADTARVMISRPDTGSAPVTVA
jgi:hypothetical protein